MFRFRLFVAALTLTMLALLPAGASAAKRDKLDPTLAARNGKGGTSRVIITLKPGADATGEVKKLGGRFGRRLSLINGDVVELPNAVLRKLADHPAIERIDWDRPTSGLMAQVANIIGARTVQYTYGYTGAGIGVAVIDSGITHWHDDLTYGGSNPAVKVQGNQRVAHFMDFVNGGTSPYDDNGHGTHVSGIIAGNGHDSRGTRAGVAPESHIVSLKVLDAQGRGVISDVIAALEYAVQNRAAYNIRVINLSVGAAVLSSYNDDPLTLAAKRAVEAGIVVVAASGNLGRNAAGQTQYGAVTAPGNAPWVLTVGASNHKGTLTRRDDEVAAFSSRGPTAIDFAAKPDILAPGTGIVSLSDRTSTFYTTKAAALVRGSSVMSYKPYLSLTGTSMAAPVVSGTVALMLQANPRLTPNLVKALLQYTAQTQDGVDYMSQGGGFLNAKGAVDLARYFATARRGDRYPHDRAWARKITWGNRRLGGGVISPFGTAWATTTIWGAAQEADGDNVVWGTECTEPCRNVVWGTMVREGDNVVWGTAGEGDNVVWGTADGDGDNVVWGTWDDGDNVVWGTIGDDGDNVVWGTTCGGDDCFNVVWGTAGDDGDNVVWGTADEGDNVVWGTSGDIPAGVWATSTIEDAPLWDLINDGIIVWDPAEFDLLLGLLPVVEPSSTVVGGGIQ
jgi:serine protease AprX